MKIFIVGAGEVGIHIASSLVREGHDLVVIERDAKKVESLQRSMECLGIIHHAAEYGNQGYAPRICFRSFSRSRPS